MKSRIFAAIHAALLAALLAAGSTLASQPLNGADARTAFNRLKTLAGDWESKSPAGNKSHLRYEVVAGGSAVVEHVVDDSMGAANAMETVYYLDGDRLLLTHYCMARNQPRMQAVTYDAGTGELRFAFLDATGLSSPAAGHMHDAKFRFVDAGHFTTEWEFFESGKAKFNESAEYTRVR